VLLLSQQPVQLFAGQALPHPSSSPWHLPTQLETQVQLPERHVGSVVGQTVQLAPALPQALAVVPAWHLPLLSQQPVQLFAGQALPHPSSSPLHFPEQ